MMMKKLLLLLLLLLPTLVQCTTYANVTLSSNDLSVTVYLPQSLASDQVFYESSRFEHGSMIGSIQRNGHTLYGTDLWRIPHNPGWTESGVGLASEFGVGDNGAFCNYKCGWYENSGVSNGVLGYLEAKNGEPFLKLGVGMLVKGSCYECDSSEDYKFNSPYAFAEMPIWTMTTFSNHEIELQHESVLHAKKFYGYRLKKHILLENNVLSVTSTLTNLGQEAFMTPWYSHHFFSCDGRAIGNGYSVELNIKPPMQGPLFQEPSLWSWSTPLRDYARVSPYIDAINVDFFRQIDDGAKIKAEFLKDEGTDGSFELRACGTYIKEEIPEILTGRSSSGRGSSSVSMYAFNLYVERGTLSPEPQLLIHLEPGKTASWTQRLEFGSMETMAASSPQPNNNNNNVAVMGSLVGAETTGSSNASLSLTSSASSMVLMLFACLLVVLATYHVLYNGRRCNSNYTPIPDGPPPQQQQQQQEHE